MKERKFLYIILLLIAAVAIGVAIKSCVKGQQPEAVKPNALVE